MVYPARWVLPNKPCLKQVFTRDRKAKLRDRKPEITDQSSETTGGLWVMWAVWAKGAVWAQWAVSGVAVWLHDCAM